MTTTRRTRTLTKIGSAGAGLGLAALAVLGFSNAAFSAQTDNAGDNWAAGKDQAITLKANTAQTAPLFSFGLDDQPRPQDDGVDISTYDGYLATDFTNLNVNDDDVGRDLTVNYSGGPAAQVRMYVDTSGATITPGLADNTLVTVKRDGKVVYENKPLSDMPTDYGEAASGQNPWNIDAGAPASSKYSVQITSDGAAVDGATAQGVKFVWEAQQA